MIIENLHILSYDTLYRDIIAKESLDYNIIRLKPDQRDDLQERSIGVISAISKCLPNSAKILHRGFTDIIFSYEGTFLPSIIPDEYSMYKYTHRFFSTGLYKDSRTYALLDGDILVSKGTILNRRDIPRACKVMFESKVMNILLNTSNMVDLGTLSFEDYVFSCKSIGRRILDVSGRKIPLEDSDTQVINSDSYTAFVDSHINNLLE